MRICPCFIENENGNYWQHVPLALYGYCLTAFLHYVLHYRKQLCVLDSQSNPTVASERIAKMLGINIHCPFGHASIAFGIVSFIGSPTPSARFLLRCALLTPNDTD
jgi:hypothetical protein